MANAPPSDFQRIAELEEQQNKIRDILFFQSTHAIGKSNTFGQGRSSNAFGSKIGGESWFPLENLVTDINEALVATGIFDKLNLQSLTTVVDALVTPIPLKFIQHISDGKIFSLTPKAGKVLEIQPGGNIDIPAVTIIADGEVGLFQFFKDTGMVKPVSLGGVGGGGANRMLSNLVAPTAINTNLLPDANTMWDLGSELLGWDIVHARQFEINVSSPAPTPSSDDVITRTDGAIRKVNFNVKQALSSFDFRHLGVIGMSIFKDAAGNIIVSGDDFDVGLQLTLQPVATNPAINGIIRHVTGGDVKVFSGGALRNFSDIGSGSGGATIELDNLGITSINADLLFANPNLNIGESGTPIDGVFLKRLMLTEPATLITSAVMIRANSGNMQLNVPLTTNFYQFLFAGGGGILLTGGTTTSIDVDDVNAGLQLTLQPTATNPAINGIIRHITGGDIKAFSGGVLRNFSDIGNASFADNIFEVHNLSDPTKKFVFDASGIFAGRTITIRSASSVSNIITLPAVTGVLASLAAVFQSFTGQNDFQNDVFLGSSVSHRVQINARLDSDIIPKNDATYNLGQNGLAFRKLYLANSNLGRLRIPVGTNLFDT